MSDGCPESYRTIKFVNECPGNEEEWNARKKLKDCSTITNATCNYGRRLEYHCLFNAHRNESIEVCAPDTIIPKDTCPEYSLKGERINGVFNCSSELGLNCPQNQYHSNTVFRYTGCIKEARFPVDQASNGGSHLAVILCSSIFGFIIVTVFGFLLYKYRRYRAHSTEDGFCSFLRNSSNFPPRCPREEGETQATVQLLDLENIHILLVGKTGSGKSSSGNTILGSQKFDTRLSPSSVTQQCKKEHAIQGEYSIHVIDTPGLFDTDNIDKEPRFSSMEKLINNDTYIIILVIAFGSICDEDLKTLDRISNFFGDNFKRRGIVLFSKKDQLNEDGGTLESYLNTADQKLKDFISQSAARVPLTFDNTSEGRKNRDQVNDLISVINSIK